MCQCGFINGNKRRTIPGTLGMLITGEAVPMQGQVLHGKSLPFSQFLL